MVIWISVVLVLGRSAGRGRVVVRQRRWTAVPHIGGLTRPREQTLQNAD